MAGFPGKEDTWDLAQGRKEGGRWEVGRWEDSESTSGTALRRDCCQHHGKETGAGLSLSVTLLVLESQMPDHKGLTGTDWIWGLGGESNRRG